MAMAIMMKKRSMPQRKRKQTISLAAAAVAKLFVSLLVLSSILYSHTAAADATTTTTTKEPLDFLNEDSVVLITGAAGFIGSELALTLHRTYAPKKILLVDSMDSTDNLNRADDLALFEFKRQRVFRVLQTLGSAAHFFRVDFCPIIPEYFDHDAAVLDFIFRRHDDVTHVVHLADPYHRGGSLFESGSDVGGNGGSQRPLTKQIIPRVKGQPKAGMMEALLEQIRKAGNETGRVPHLTYASSSDVYNHLRPNNKNDNQDPNPPPFREDRPITTPSTLAGASKLIDEILAQTYHQAQQTQGGQGQGLYSVGLRFFCVYGPWGLPGSPVFEMAERAVTGDTHLLPQDVEFDVTATGTNSAPGTGTGTATTVLDHTWDFVYIDDAVDAIMSAMQFRPVDDVHGKSPEPIVINVGSGEGRTLRDVGKLVQEYFPQAKLPTIKSVADQESSSKTSTTATPTVSLASTDRARQLLGYEPRVSFQQGMENVLTWHYDRAFPYGGRNPDAIKSNSTEEYIASQGIVACSPYDDECLRGTPVFPCASECSHEGQCLPSVYDDVVTYTKLLTAACEVVMYTVALEEDLLVIPSAQAQVSTTSKSHVEQNSDDNSFCNIAFVSDTSPLVQRLEADRGPFSTRSGQVLLHGFWALVPVTVSTFAAESKGTLSLLPKLSPGLFFTSTTRRAIYCDPDVIFDNIDTLLEEASMQPFSDDAEGATAILIGKGPSTGQGNARARETTASVQSTVQEHAYRMVRIAVIDELYGEGFSQHLDSSFVVHTMNSDDSRLFRCDVFGEVVQWGVTTDRSAFEFILGLHDMWSRVLVVKAGQEPWWIGQGVETIPEGSDIREEQYRRRRLEEDLDSEEDVDGEGDDGIAPDDKKTGDGDGDGEGDDGITPDDKKTGDDGVSPDGKKSPWNSIGDHNGFGEQVDKTKVAPDGQNLPGEQVEGNSDANEDDEAASKETEVDDDGDGNGNDNAKNNEVRDNTQPKSNQPGHPKVKRDVSSYDIWMGILSSTNVRYFARIVPASTVGAVRLESAPVATN
jgi:UDP-glucuronate 4-epimerase